MEYDLISIASYPIRGVRDPVNRIQIAGRTVDFWSPAGSEHLIVTHDGQNIFDRRTATRGITWRLAEQATETFLEFGLHPPTIVAVFHSSGDREPNGRVLDLTPEKYFREGMPVLSEIPQGVTINHLRGDAYLDLIFEAIIPTILGRLNIEIHFKNRAMLGSSMGGLATLYEIARQPDRYSTALAYSPHWILGGDTLVKEMIQSLPNPGLHRIWMSRGTRQLDSSYESHQALADILMRERGWISEAFSSKVYQRAGHNERAWSKQVDDGLRFWLNKF